MKIVKVKLLDRNRECTIYDITFSRWWGKDITRTASRSPGGFHRFLTGGLIYDFTGINHMLTQLKEVGDEYKPL